MVRKIILNLVMYNSEKLRVLDFILQCYEMYEDDVVSWSLKNNVPNNIRFDKYREEHAGIDIDALWGIRNEYVHGFDTETKKLLDDMSGITVSDLVCLCNYFGVEFPREFLLGSLGERIQILRGLIGEKEESSGS